MQAIIVTNGTPEEIAAIALAVQERRGESLRIVDPDESSLELGSSGVVELR